jgi:ABC-type polysaccharide/polyol phosphate transport system ATPase subunit
MSLLTVFSKRVPQSDEPLIILDDVAVRYRVPRERIPSFKEFVIRWLKKEVSYQEFWALKNINLEIRQGEVLGIIGPNGAGKSTLLKVVARVLRPTKGRVRINGNVAPLLELVAGFDYELTGRENIYLNGAILGYSRPDIDRRFDRIVDFAGLVDFIDAPLRTYSTGMVARLGFSVATDVRPEILIVDEILGVGDAQFQTKSFERIQSFQAEGTTILLVSHSLGKVEEMCTRAIWLDHGEEKISGPTKTVVNRYLRQVFGVETEPLASKIKVQSESRWGSQKIEITRVRITDSVGVEQSIFQTGDTVLVHIEYIANEPVKSPVFGLAVHRQDGLHITGPNTDTVNMTLPTLHGSGKMIYTIPYLPLLEGLYHFSIAVVNQTDTEIFDYHDRLYPLRVANLGHGVKEKYGAITFQGDWIHEPEKTRIVKNG